MAWPIHRHWVSVLLAVALLAGASNTAWAHAILMESTPKLNSTVKGPDFTILLRFNVRIDGSRSRVHLVAPGGSSVTLDIETQTSPDSLKSTAHDLRPGAYKLVWQVLASDGHMTRGEVPFTVN